MLPTTVAMLRHYRPLADVEMAELTASGRLRQASFKGLRVDKTSDELRAESEA